MIPKAVIPEEDYRAAFLEYVNGLALKWLGGGIESLDVASVADRIEEVSRENYRATYLKFLLPLANIAYRKVMADNAVSMQKVLYNMRLNGIPYNDFMLHRFCDICLQSADREGLFSTPLPEDYKDLQKLVWTFVQAFRKRAASKYDVEASV